MDLADEETGSQRVLGLLLILLTVGLLVVAVLECLWEARRLSHSNRGGDDDDFHIFRRRRRRDGKPKEGNGGGKGGAGGDAMDDKLRASGALYAPKLLDVPINRVRAGGMSAKRVRVCLCVWRACYRVESKITAVAIVHKHQPLS